MEEFRENYVKQVGRQLDELPKQQKKTMLDGLRQELEEDCAGQQLWLIPNKPPEELARELREAVDPKVYRQHRSAKRRRAWCAFSTVALLLVMAICGVCYMYHAMQIAAYSYAVVTVERNSYPYRPLDSIAFTFEWAADADFTSEWATDTDFVSELASVACKN